MSNEMMKILFSMVGYMMIVIGIGIYELLPAFVLSCIVIVVLFLLTKAPSKDIQDEFDQAVNG